ncbi:MAG TPA: hypothetical protein DEG96_00005 [Candidatus Atribacteria bacterium]|nr:hypothetical protein [Candidatus Atribacteria bacterium]
MLIYLFNIVAIKRYVPFFHFFTKIFLKKKDLIPSLSYYLSLDGSISIYDLCNRMKINDSGDNYRRVKRALEKIQMTGIKSEGAFYHKDKKQWITKIFGLYDGVIFKGEQLEDDIIAETNLLYLGDIYLQSLNSFYIKPIDYDYLQSLKSKIASRLYEILGVKFYGLRNKREKFICYRYSKLCQLLPVTPHKYISLAKQQLNPGNNELRDTGFISKYEWSENSKKDWLIYYWLGDRAKEEMKRVDIKGIDSRTGEYLPGPKEDTEEFSKEQLNLINKLVKMNVSKVTAENLMKSNDQELIEKWIKAINYSNADDKAAYLVKAIRENWQFPEEYLKEKREEQRKEEEIRKEAENRLPDFWKERLNRGRDKGKTSKLLEVVLEEKRREIIKEWIGSGRIEDINSK